MGSMKPFYLACWVGLVATACSSPEPMLPGDYSDYNVILISVDTLRADHLGLYGYERETSPTLDRIASESIVFDRAYATRGMTWPSLVSMFTGLYPITTNVRDNGDLLPEGVLTWPNILASEGYQTIAFLSNACGAIEGPFDVFFCDRSDQVVNQRAIRWVKEQSSAQSPFFLWVHYWGPHEEYRPDPEFNVFVDPDYDGAANGTSEYLDPLILSQKAVSRADIGHVVDLYDGEVLGTDALIEALWQALSEQGLLDNSIIVLTSDHGEELAQHAGYYYHSCSTYEAVLHVPLLIHLPKGRLKSTRVSQIVENIDIMPTVLDMLGVDLLESYEGQSALPLLNRDPASSEAFSRAIAEYYYYRVGWVWSIRTDRWRYVYNPDKTVPMCRPRGSYFQLESQELYDHSVDPQELHNVASEHPRVAAALEVELLAAFGNRKPPKRAKRSSPEVLEQLKELGYITD